MERDPQSTLMASIALQPSPLCSERPHMARHALPPALLGVSCTLPTVGGPVTSSSWELPSTYSLEIFVSACTLGSHLPRGFLGVWRSADVPLLSASACPKVTSSPIICLLTVLSVQRIPEFLLLSLHTAS